MRHAPSYLLAILVAAGISGCGPQIGDSADPVTAILDAASTPTDSQTSSASTPPADSNDQNDNSSSAPPDVTRTFTGFVNGVGEYELLSLGPGNMGDKWVITPTSPFDGPFVVVLFDADQNLLMRSYMSYNNVMHHTLRADADEVYLGIMPSYATGRGGTFGLRTRVQSGQAIPTPRRQIVYLNFAGGTNVQVHTRAAMSFGPFDGVLVGDAYAEHTEEMKAVILAEMCADYADFDIAFHTSDDGPPPDSPYSTVHFGGDEPGLLGLADSVDSYNHNLSQQAVVYVDNFAPYWTMRLQPDEMAVMIANVASHELGHLLGLYHTQRPGRSHGHDRVGLGPGGHADLLARPARGECLRGRLGRLSRPAQSHSRPTEERDGKIRAAGQCAQR